MPTTPDFTKEMLTDLAGPGGECYGRQPQQTPESVGLGWIRQLAARWSRLAWW